MWSFRHGSDAAKSRASEGEDMKDARRTSRPLPPLSCQQIGKPGHRKCN